MPQHRIQFLLQTLLNDLFVLIFAAQMIMQQGDEKFLRNLHIFHRYPGTRLYEVTDTTDPDFPEKHMAVSFRYRLLDEFLKEWQLRKKQLREGEITKEEYLEWKLNWPQTADGCGRYEPKKKWRKK
jgi:hypothetical protein